MSQRVRVFSASLSAVGFLFGVLAQARSETPTDVLMDRWVSGKRKYRVVISSKPSRPLAQGRGYCGAGEEVSLQIFSDRSPKKAVLTRLIESCLESIELRDGRLGTERPQDIEKAVTIDGTKVRFPSIRDATPVEAWVDLSTDPPTFFEEATRPMRLEIQKNAKGGYDLSLYNSSSKEFSFVHERGKQPVIVQLKDEKGRELPRRDLMAATSSTSELTDSNVLTLKPGERALLVSAEARELDPPGRGRYVLSVGRWLFAGDSGEGIAPGRYRLEAEFHSKVDHVISLRDKKSHPVQHLWLGSAQATLADWKIP